MSFVTEEDVIEVMDQLEEIGAKKIIERSMLQFEKNIQEDLKKKMVAPKGKTRMEPISSRCKAKLFNLKS